MRKHVSVPISVYRWDCKASGCAQTRGPRLKTTGYLQGQISLSSFRCWSNEYQELLGTYWFEVNCHLVVGLRSWDTNLILKRAMTLFSLIIFFGFYRLNTFVWLAVMTRSLTPFSLFRIHWESVICQFWYVFKCKREDIWN